MGSSLIGPVDCLGLRLDLPLLAHACAIVWLVVDMIKLYSILADYFIDDIRCHFAASMISGLVTTLASMPVDIAKTRLVGIY